MSRSFVCFKKKTAYEMLRSLVGSEMCIRDSIYSGVRLSFGAGTNFQVLVDSIKPLLQQLAIWSDTGIQFDMVGEEIAASKDPSHPSVHQTTLLWNFDLATSDQHTHWTEIDLVIRSEPTEQFAMWLVYSTQLFSETTASEIGRRLCVLLDKVMDEPSRPLEQVSMLDSQEADKVLGLWNQTTQEYGGRTAYDLLDGVAAVYPSKTALIFEGDELTYLSLIHISEPTRLLSISYAVFCLKKKNRRPQVC
eukprot:TRINITY_DN33010_c0_g1_i1.p1 TRINITY_DN33010_c0_g1~~TRINITY_DN33010_c0_g1_i1.p1  ORF type:complete len:262 (-),score=65.94 TRINITY_DN33010_c0_g1_i1:41-787(-)